MRRRFQKFCLFEEDKDREAAVTSYNVGTAFKGCDASSDALH